jgi:hypothetical protein
MLTSTTLDSASSVELKVPWCLFDVVVTPDGVKEVVHADALLTDLLSDTTNTHTEVWT